MKNRLLEQAARLRDMARRCDDLANQGQIPSADRDELHKAAGACRELADELEAAAAQEC